MREFSAGLLSLDNVQEETWYIDGGNWVYNIDTKILIGHVKNCLEFLNGNNPIWYNKRRR